MKPWTNREIEFLHANYATMGAKGCGQALGRSADSAKQAAHKYGAPLSKHQWSEADVEFLRQHYPTKGSKFVADHVKSTPGSVIRKAILLGVKYTGPNKDTHKRCYCCSEWKPKYVFPHDGHRCVVCENLRKPKHWRAEIEGMQRQAEREASEEAQRRAA